MPRIRGFYLILFAIGLGIRAFFVPQMGTHDIDTILSWGRDVRDLGLPQAYHGIYFPIEYQLSALAIFASRELDVSAVTSLKAIVLAFDVGVFALLALVLRAWRLDGRNALIYWLHPYFVLLTCLGYVDPHLGLMILACLLILARVPGSPGFLAAGVPLGLAFMMKPQAIGLVAVIPLLVLAAVVLQPGHRRENLRPLLLLVGPAVIFAAYSLYFAHGGEGLTAIAHTYTPGELTRQSAGLTSQMVNVWYPVALALRHDHAAVYTVAHPTVLNTVGGLAAGLVIAGSVTVLVRARPVIGSREVAFAFMFAALTVPMIATHAHENHLYLGLLLSIPAVAAARDRSLMWPLQGLLAAQFLNLFAVQKLGANHFSNGWLIDFGNFYGGNLAPQLILVAVSVACWCWLLAGLLRSVAAVPGRDQEHLPGQGAYGQA